MNLLFVFGKQWRRDAIGSRRVDIIPTILSILGIQIPHGIDGRDIHKSLWDKNLCNYGILSSYLGKGEVIEELKKTGKSNLSYGW